MLYPRTQLHVRSGSRGAVMVEYALILFAVAIPAAMGLVAGGIQLRNDYVQVRDAIVKPTP